MKTACSWLVTSEEVSAINTQKTIGGCIVSRLPLVFVKLSALSVLFCGSVERYIATNRLEKRLTMSEVSECIRMITIIL